MAAKRRRAFDVGAFESGEGERQAVGTLQGWQRSGGRSIGARDFFGEGALAGQPVNSESLASSTITAASRFTTPF